MNKGGKILLAGDISGVFADIGDILKSGCEIRTNILDAIDAAGGGGFATIGLTIPTKPGRLSAPLRALRENSEARIVLLARMPQEPKAIELIKSGLADDYLICPITLTDISAQNSDRTSRSSARKKSTTAARTQPVLDEATQDRIAQLERLATEDDLTGLKNRKYVW